MKMTSARELLTSLGIGGFTATMIIQYMFMAPATTDPKSPSIIVLVKHLQKALNRLGARIRETGYLDIPTANAMDQVAGPGWESSSWGTNVRAVLAAIRQRREGAPIPPLQTAASAASAGAPPPTPTLGFVDLPSVPGGAITYLAGGLLAYHLWMKRKR